MSLLTIVILAAVAALAFAAYNYFVIKKMDEGTEKDAGDCFCHSYRCRRIYPV